MKREDELRQDIARQKLALPALGGDDKTKSSESARPIQIGNGRSSTSCGRYYNQGRLSLLLKSQIDVFHAVAVRGCAAARSGPASVPADRSICGRLPRRTTGWNDQRSAAHAGRIRGDGVRYDLGTSPIWHGKRMCPGKPVRASENCAGRMFRKSSRITTLHKGGRPSLL